MDKYLYWLDRIDGLGTLSKRNLLEAFGSAQEVFRASDKYLNYILEERKCKLLSEARKMVEIEKAFEDLLKSGIQFVCYHQADFPEKLLTIPDAPFSIYYKGRLPENEIPAVAIIGARECSGYGEYVATELGKLLGLSGIQVISGMAKGIDGISQWAALEAGGISFGVLGCGVDVCYPKSNQKVYEQLVCRGGILSTYPPGTLPKRQLFPPRNRIVSGLADVLVVIEARQKSGTSITVDMALEQGRDIYAVPGRVTDRLSDGCNKMIKDGAHVFLSPEDFLMDLQELLPLKRNCAKDINYSKLNNYISNKTENIQGICDEPVDDLAKQIVSVLDFYPKSLDEIAILLETKFQVTCKQELLSSQMILLCLSGLANQDSQGWYSKNVNSALQ